MKYEYEVQGNYGQGWECVNTELTREKAQKSLRDYNINEPEFSHRIKKVKVS